MRSPSILWDGVIWWRALHFHNQTRPNWWDGSVCQCWSTFIWQRMEAVEYRTLAKWQETDLLHFEDLGATLVQTLAFIENTLMEACDCKSELMIFWKAFMGSFIRYLQVLDSPLKHNAEMIWTVKNVSHRAALLIFPQHAFAILNIKLHL